MKRLISRMILTTLLLLFFTTCVYVQGAKDPVVDTTDKVSYYLVKHRDGRKQYIKSGKSATIIIDLELLNYLPNGIVEGWVKVIPQKGEKLFLEIQKKLRDKGHDYANFEYYKYSFEVDCIKKAKRIKERIISLGPSLTEELYLLGAEKKI
ncbi:hypothetical protein J7M02_00805 [Candidatus Aerophobetes bacterium]|nr:hypothetical protein [Candidatus Aerophobetes bacterium]